MTRGHARPHSAFARSPPPVSGLLPADADVLADGRRRGLPHLAGAGVPLHAGDQLPPLAPHVGPREGLSLHAPVHLPGGAPSRQPRHGLHQRRRRSTRRCSRRSARRRARSTWSATSSSPGRSPTSSSTELSAKRARNGVNVTIVVDAHRQPGAVGPAGAAAAQGGLPHPVVPAPALVLAGAAQQPHPPRAADRRRHGRVHRRRRHRRLVGVPTFKRLRWHKPWRDTMARIEGPVVAALQGVAAENWLECCGEILTGPGLLPQPRDRAATRRRSSSRARRRIARPRRASRSSC